MPKWQGGVSELIAQTGCVQKKHHTTNFEVGSQALCFDQTPMYLQLPRGLIFMHDASYNWSIDRMRHPVEAW